MKYLRSGSHSSLAKAPLPVRRWEHGTGAVAAPSLAIEGPLGTTLAPGHPHSGNLGLRG